MKILKFGGSSVATPESIRQVVHVVRQRQGPVVVVVSALGGVTDELLRAARLAAGGDEAWVTTLEGLETRHLGALLELAPADELDALREELSEELHDLKDLLHGAFLVREASPRTLDSITSYGERLSSKIVAAALRQEGIGAAAVDARGLIRTDDAFGSAQVDLEATRELVRRHFDGNDTLSIVTGFIASTAGGETTTLGRGGSDYTASLLGACLDADAVELWTDVDGVMSADPRLVPNARPIPELAYDELMELSHFGAKVVHPPSVHPTRSAGIPLWIKNTFHPEHHGTRVTDEERPPAAGDDPICGVASINSVALLRLEGDGMIGVPGIAARLFGALARRQVSVILISQASSEHSICFAVAPSDVEAARRAVAEEFDLEQRAGLIDPLVVEDEMSIVAAVGAGMRQRAGIAGKVFSVLGGRGINVRAISQGSSELNISLVVARVDEGAALRSIHDAFIQEKREVSIAVAGVGRVGQVFLDQLASRQDALADERGLVLRLVGVAGRRRHAYDPDGLDPRNAAARMEDGGLDVLVEALLKNRGRRVFVDMTASEAVTEVYDRLLATGVHVVAANKLRVAGPGAAWRSLRGKLGRLYFETTVGAGLPVIRTLEDLVATGDRVERIDGVLSGTLGYLCDQLGQGVAFSDVVRRAHELGYTEPDPREDLGGTDVARKLLVLGRLSGRTMELDDVRVESLLPSDWADLSLDDFWRRLPELDASFEQRQADAAAAGRRLCYVAVLDDEGARVSLQAVDADHPCGNIRGTDNLIAISTARYREIPLVVRGPGAGTEVTAAGVFGDVLRAVAENP